MWASSREKLILLHSNNNCAIQPAQSDQSLRYSLSVVYNMGLDASLCTASTQSDQHNCYSLAGKSLSSDFLSLLEWDQVQTCTIHEMHIYLSIFLYSGDHI